MRKKIFLPLFLFVLFGIVFVSAQSNEIIDRILSEKKASFGDAALVVLSAGGVIPEKATVIDAVKYIKENYSQFLKKSAEDPINASEFSFLLMKTFNLKGGIMYMLFPGPRYAYRELLYRKVLSVKGGPYRKITGEDLLRALQIVLETEEAEK